MFCGAVGLVVLAVAAFGGVGAEVAHRWDKTTILPQMGLNNWRATSFAIAEDKVFLTLVDIEKQESGNGVVGAFKMSASTSPDVSIFPFQNFYKINDPLRGKITTPVTVRTDCCDRLWLLDSAVQNISGVQLKTNPAIYIFNTNTSQLIRSFNIPSTQWTSTSFFVNFVVSTENTQHDCEKSYGYFADFNRFHLLTYDFLRNKSELKSHPFFSPDPLVHIPNDLLFNHGHQDLNGLFGLAIVPDHHPDMYTLYFHPLAGTHEFRIRTRLLKADGNVNYQDAEIYRDRGPNAESGVSVFDPETETIFFAEVNTKKIGALRLRGHHQDSQPTTYYRYDFNLKSGYIVDLNVHRSALWVLVDDKSDVTIYKLPIAEINEEFRRIDTSQHQSTPATLSFASHAAFQPALLYFFVFLPLYGSL